MEDYFEHHKELMLSGGGKIVIQGSFNAFDLCGADRHTIKLLIAVIEDHDARINGASGNRDLLDLAEISASTREA